MVFDDVGRVAQDRVGLAGTGLSIREDAAIEALSFDGGTLKLSSRTGCPMES